jgi:hypothetical protein
MRAPFSHLRHEITGLPTRHRTRGVALIALPHILALAVMVVTESSMTAMAAFLLTWGIFNFVAIALTRRPLFAGLISLVLMMLLVLLSQLKYDVLMMTANFVDLMIVDTDTVSFLFTIFPGLKTAVTLTAAALVPLLICAWRFEAFRARRSVAVFSAIGCLGGLIALETHSPMQPFEAFYGGNLVSSFARSGVDAIAELMTHGLMRSDAVALKRLQPFADKCRPAAQPPHIILIHDESSFDIRMAPGIKVPRGYGAHFKSFDGEERNFLVEGNGGPSWYTEYNVLAGLSARSFGRFAYFVTRIAAGRVNRGLPAALQRCGYRTCYRPDLMTGWQDLGNAPRVDEYLRRQAMSAKDYTEFQARLKRDFPNDAFLIVRFGDHQPDFAASLIDPTLDENGIARRLMAYDPRYFTTYYAIDAINFTPVDMSSALGTLEGPYLPLVVQEAAGLPLDPSFAEQKKILFRCKGLFFGCANGAEASHFNRMLIDAGLIKNL